MNTQTLTVLDRLIQKPVNMEFDDKKLAKLTHGDMVVYTDTDNKEYVGEFLWYHTRSEKKGTYIRPVAGRELDKFESNRKKADKLYTSVFLPIFEKNFPKAKPVSARMSLHGNHIYFYFCSEQRLNFSSLLPTFREKLSMKFFLYQVNPRDRVRLHPNLDEWYDPNGLPLSYSIFKHPLPNVPNDAIEVQWLRGRHIEKMKDRSGMVDHTFSYEYDFYKTESKKYPWPWAKVTYKWKKYLCIKSNFLTQEITMRGEDDRSPGEFYGEYITISLEDRTSDESRSSKENETPRRRTNKRRSSKPSNKESKSRPSVQKKRVHEKKPASKE